MMSGCLAEDDSSPQVVPLFCCCCSKPLSNWDSIPAAALVSQYWVQVTARDFTERQQEGYGCEGRQNKM